MTESSLIRFGIFAATLATMLCWEWRKPFRGSPEPKGRRLARHLGLMTLNFIALRLLTGGGAYGMAALAAEHQWGLFRTFALPGWLALGAALLILDFAIYAQHVVFHKVPLLWRLHQVHHSDLIFDTTTAIRFHPGEIVLSMFFKMALVAALGITPFAVLVFEAVLNACAQFNHGNVRLGRHVERLCRFVLITPDLHRIHHSCDRLERDTNFGFSVPWWDWICGTYRGSPSRGQTGLRIGLDEMRDYTQLRLADLLKLPFSRPGAQSMGD